MNPQLPAAGAYDQLKSAVLGAQANPAASGSPLGSFPELAKLYSIPNQVAAGGLANSAANYNTGVQASNQVADAKAKASELQQRIKNYSDPSKYQRIKKGDGGYAFYDPEGNEISAYDYANVAGKNPSDVLKDSENPIDKGYSQDFKNLNDYINAKLNSKFSEDDKKKAAEIEKEVKDNQGIDLSGMNVDEIIQKFKQAYPTVYGGTNTGVRSGSTLLPRASGIDTSGGGTI